MGVAAKAETMDGEIAVSHALPNPDPGETTPSSAPILHLAGFDGPMDLLLDLAERQRLDLGQVSLVDLVDQFVAALAKMSGRVPIDRLADWLVLATRLVLLRSRLLTATPEEVETAERDAAAELLRLDDMSRMRRAVRWLDQRPVLGRDVFSRPRGRNPRTETYITLMEACLVVLRGRAGRPEAAPIYHIVVPDFWRVSDALARIGTLLQENPDETPLGRFLPPLAEGAAHNLKLRAAVASTLVAGLELTRDGQLWIGQGQAFSLITVGAAPQPARQQSPVTPAQ